MGDADDKRGNTTSPSRGPGRASSRAHVTRLVVLASADEAAVGRAIVLTGERQVIGRAGHVEVGLGLEDRELSRIHAALEPQAWSASWELVDLDSRNGCFVNGKSVTREALTDGAVIRAGSTLLLFQELALKAGEPLEAEREPLLGPSLAMQRLRAELSQVAPQPIAVLLLGESGVGKELAAVDLHRRSRRPGAFVPVNCAALPENLVESELFGHVAGAFTGAERARPGLFAAARGGTLFLDEVGELSPTMQPKLLRALAGGEVRPVGAVEPQRLDVRVVAATNRVTLEAAVADGSFRGDLYARLAGWTTVIPPLRTRKDDVLPLARHFLQRAAAQPVIGVDAAEALLLHNWPFNVRELEQAISAAAVRCGAAPELDLGHLAPELTRRLEARAGAPSATVEPPVEALVRRDGVPTREELELALRRSGGNVAKVAELFGKDRRQIYRWAERLGIDPDDFRV
jgi:transcriptional regulator with GAF, ATPase, and Fis domain